MSEQEYDSMSQSDDDTEFSSPRRRASVQFESSDSETEDDVALASSSSIDAENDDDYLPGSTTSSPSPPPAEATDLDLLGGAGADGDSVEAAIVASHYGQPPQTPHRGSSRTRALVERARARFHERDYILCVRLLLAALANSPNNSDARLLLFEVAQETCTLPTVYKVGKGAVRAAVRSAAAGTARDNAAGVERANHFAAKLSEVAHALNDPLAIVDVTLLTVPLHPPARREQIILTASQAYLEHGNVPRAASLIFRAAQYCPPRTAIEHVRSALALMQGYSSGAQARSAAAALPLMRELINAANGYLARPADPEVDPEVDAAGRADAQTTRDELLDMVMRVVCMAEDAGNPLLATEGLSVLSSLNMPTLTCLRVRAAAQALALNRIKGAGDELNTIRFNESMTAFNEAFNDDPYAITAPAPDIIRVIFALLGAREYVFAHSVANTLMWAVDSAELSFAKFKEGAPERMHEVTLEFIEDLRPYLCLCWALTVANVVLWNDRARKPSTIVDVPSAFNHQNVESFVNRILGEEGIYSAEHNQVREARDLALRSAVAALVLLGAGNGAPMPAARGNNFGLPLYPARDAVEQATLLIAQLLMFDRPAVALACLGDSADAHPSTWPGPSVDVLFHNSLLGLPLTMCQDLASDLAANPLTMLLRALLRVRLGKYEEALAILEPELVRTLRIVAFDSMEVESTQPLQAVQAPVAGVFAEDDLPDNEDEDAVPEDEIDIETSGTETVPRPPLYSLAIVLGVSGGNNLLELVCRLLSMRAVSASSLAEFRQATESAANIIYQCTRTGLLVNGERAGVRLYGPIWWEGIPAITRLADVAAIGPAVSPDGLTHIVASACAGIVGLHPELDLLAHAFAESNQRDGDHFDTTKLNAARTIAWDNRPLVARPWEHRGHINYVHDMQLAFAVASNRSDIAYAALRSSADRYNRTLAYYTLMYKLTERNNIHKTADKSVVRDARRSGENTLASTLFHAMTGYRPCRTTISRLQHALMLKRGDPGIELALGIAFLGYANSKVKGGAGYKIASGFAHLTAYAKARGQFNPEAAYNMARAAHHCGMLGDAVNFYLSILQSDDPTLTSRPIADTGASLGLAAKPAHEIPDHTNPQPVHALYRHGFYNNTQVTAPALELDMSSVSRRLNVTSADRGFDERVFSRGYDIRREAAHNLAVIFEQSGNRHAAEELRHCFCMLNEHNDL